MNPADVKAAMADAERFLKRCKELFAVDVTTCDYRTNEHKTQKWNGHKYAASKQTAAVRRASMDLTRSLAEMRKR